MEEELKAKEVELVRGNPLMNPNFSVKRRYESEGRRVFSFFYVGKSYFTHQVQ